MPFLMSDTFHARKTLTVDGVEYAYWALDSLRPRFEIDRLPFVHKILLENLLRFEDGSTVTTADIEALAAWDSSAVPDREIAFRPSRVLLQDFTGVPAVVDLAAMRDAMQRLGGDPSRINPRQPAELVIDHSVQVDHFGTPQALRLNAERESERNRERYAFLRWGQTAFDNLAVVPPATGIVHQVNLEYLARVVFSADGALYPDTLVGTDSHTTMINGLGVLGWGVGGIEAEAAMLGQPLSMLIPQVVGVRLIGELLEGTTATDLVLTVTQRLRERGVVGKFVEFFGAGLDHLPLADRATIANMSPEYGATCGIFPIDGETLRYLELSGRPAAQIAVVEAYARRQGLFRERGEGSASYSDVLELDLGSVEPSLAGPKRPQDRIVLREAKKAFARDLEDDGKRSGGRGADGTARERSVSVELPGGSCELRDGAVVIAAITSCTNTSNPAVMIGAGLLARKACEKGLRTKPWVKTSLAPGSRVVTEYLTKSGLLPHLETLGFHVVGYGCTTCIGNSGPLPEEIDVAVRERDLAVCAVLSGNRNYEGRVHAATRMNYLASPPLVVAYALAGRMDIDLVREPIGTDQHGADVWLRDLWPSRREIAATVTSTIRSSMFAESYGDLYAGDERWNALEVPEGDRYVWEEASTYIRRPPFFEGMSAEPEPPADIHGARVLALLGDTITTDHISPAGAIPLESPAGRYLVEQGVDPREFNSYGSRRGNHEVMMRGTFANVRLRNFLAPGTEGGWTRRLPEGEVVPIYDAAMGYVRDGVPLLVIAGREYGSGSSRDWAAKGTRLLGVRAVLAESYERIHRSNLIGMGVLPLQFAPGQTAASQGLTGEERFEITGVEDLTSKEVTVIAVPPDGAAPVTFTARVRIDTAMEEQYFRHGGILPFVLRQMLEE